MAEQDDIVLERDIGTPAATAAATAARPPPPPPKPPPPTTAAKPPPPPATTASPAEPRKPAAASAEARVTARRLQAGRPAMTNVADGAAASRPRWRRKRCPARGSAAALGRLAPPPPCRCPAAACWSAASASPPAVAPICGHRAVACRAVGRRRQLIAAFTPARSPARNDPVPRAPGQEPDCRRDRENPSGSRRPPSDVVAELLRAHSDCRTTPLPVCRIVLPVVAAEGFTSGG